MNTVMHNPSHSPATYVSRLLCCVTLLVSLFLSSTLVSADDNTEVVDQINITVPVACTMSGTGQTSHNATLNPGTYSGASGSEYEAGIGKTTITTYCNDNNGFSIYAIGFTGDLYEGESHTKLIGQNTNQSMSTKVYANGDTDSNWSMKVTKVDNPASGDPITYNPDNMSIQNSFNSWHVVPDVYTKVAQFNSSTTNPATTDTTLGAKLETTYATYISSAQAADTYQGQVKYTMVHPYDEEPVRPYATASGKICYYANAGTAEGTMGCQNVGDSDTSKVLSASNFSRAGYGFAGWSDKYDYKTNEEANFYGPNESLTFTAGKYTGANSGLSLYAVWVKSVGYFQDTSITEELCGSSSSGLAEINYNSETGLLSATFSNLSALTDNRDNQTYAIAKLADGNCWMIENLRLDNTAQLTALNTNNPLNDGTNVTLKHNYTDTDTYNTLSSNSTVAYNETTALDGWCTNSTSECIDQSRLRTTNTANRATYSYNDIMPANANLYAYGNYYNWYSATAGRGVYNIGSGNASGDLCPSGWRLPYGNTGTSSTNPGGKKGGLSYLDKQMGGTGGAGGTNSVTGKSMSIYWRLFPNNYLFSGYVTGSSISYRGSIGSSWTLTVYGKAAAYSLFLNKDGVRPGTLNSYSNDKFDGRIVRCLKLSDA